MFKIDWKNFVWSSNWNGYEVGYDDILTVGLYRLKGTQIYFYINMETDNILEYWSEDDE